VDGEVDLPFEQGAFELCGEDAGTAKTAQRTSGRIAGGANFQNLDIESIALRQQEVAHPMGLDEGEFASATANNEFHEANFCCEGCFEYV